MDGSTMLEPMTQNPEIKESNPGLSGRELLELGERDGKKTPTLLIMTLLILAILITLKMGYTTYT
jgi:hypothetical protein